MRSFLLLLGTQILRQIAASGHGDEHVCAASFWDESVATGSSDVSDTVVIVTEGADEVPAGNMIELGAMITEAGAWMTISDGAFVTIDTDKLECGLGGCEVTSAQEDNNAIMQLGYDKQSDELVLCDAGDHDEDFDESDECPDFDGNRYFEDGSHMHYCQENTDLNHHQCTMAGLSWEAVAATSCSEAAMQVQYHGIANLDDYSKAIFQDRCCGLPPTAPDECPDFNTETTISEAYGVCILGENQYYDYTMSQSSCGSSGGYWQVTPRYTCGDYALYMNSDYYFPDDYGDHAFRLACCPSYTPTWPSYTSTPYSWYYYYTTTETTTEEEACPATCSGETCDQWLEKTSFTCSTLEDGYGCNCGGCECAADHAQMTCEADLCFERTCPEWEGKHGVKCEILKDVFGCSCSGCDCAQTVNKCGSPQHKGDNYCDDDNNVEDCDWDGGDCCDLGFESADQFVYCNDCQCSDPQGQPVMNSCVMQEYQGDFHCDDGNNKASCDWDGGDCCGDISTQYCDDCLCLDPSHTGSRCIWPHHHDGFCDDANNNAECSWDGGDCCPGSGHSGQYRYCEECMCNDPEAHANAERCEGTCGSGQHSGDLYCDDDNNNCGCGWDGGDCCGKTGTTKQFEYCFQCACMDAGYVEPDCPVAGFRGDGICDDDNNIGSCNWDDGDCCIHEEGSPRQFDFCEQCEEHYCG